MSRPTKLTHNGIGLEEDFYYAVPTASALLAHMVAGKKADGEGITKRAHGFDEQNKAGLLAHIKRDMEVKLCRFEQYAGQVEL